LAHDCDGKLQEAEEEARQEVVHHPLFVDVPSVDQRLLEVERVLKIMVEERSSLVAPEAGKKGV